jgi:putative oxidoreductase
MDLGRLLLRVVLGGLFVGHGTQKLYGWFGGGGPDGTGQMMESLGLRPGKRHAVLAGATEAGGGLLLAAGAATPLAAAGLSGVMVTAIRKVHWQNGVWNANGGYEFNALVLATLAGLVETGPGRWSADAALGQMRRGEWWALGALGAGALGSLVFARSSEAEEFDQEAADRPPVAASG